MHSRPDRRLLKQTAAMVAVVALALTLTPQPSHSQVTLRGGVNLTDFFGSDADDTESVRSLSYGLAMSLITIGPAQVVLEGYYRKKGAGWDAVDALVGGGSPVAFDSAQVAAWTSQVGTLSGQQLEFGLDYVEVPVLLRWNFPTQGTRYRPYLNAGPAFAWRLDCGLTLDGSGGGAEAACEDLSRDNLEETLKEYELGLAVGGGLDVFVLGGSGAINVDARLTRGLSRLSEEAGGEVKNQSFTLLLGYAFGF